MTQYTYSVYVRYTDDTTEGFDVHTQEDMVYVMDVVRSKVNLMKDIRILLITRLQ